MSIFMIERNYAEKLAPSLEVVEGVNAVNDQSNVRWLYSFLSADMKKSYCLYEAESPEAIRAAAEKAGIPADVITEVKHQFLSNGQEVELSDKHFQS